MQQDNVLHDGFDGLDLTDERQIQEHNESHHQTDDKNPINSENIDEDKTDIKKETATHSVKIDQHIITTEIPKSDSADEKDESIVSPIPIAGDDEIKFSSNVPYQLVDILKETSFKFSDLAESKITCIEAWELNLYIGTSFGEIIHLYKIDDTLGYIQISKQNFSSTTSKPIHKIIVLPEISISLVHCGTTVSGYMLPELSPANIGKVKDVSDISIDWKDLKIDDDTHNYITKKESYNGEPYVKATIFTKKSIKLLRIFRDSIRLHQELKYTDLYSGIQMSNFSIVSNSENYDLIDISQSQKIYLFPISSEKTKTQDNGLTPMIVYVDEDELLLICGGSNTKEPSMGMFINLNGDVVRGTLTFESFPTSLTVDYPYVLAVLEDRKIVVYSIYDQEKLQEIELNSIYKIGGGIKIHSTNRIFEIKDPDLLKKITIAPIVSTMENDEIERIAVESDNAIKKSVTESSCILYDTMGNYLKILKPQSNIDRWLEMYFKSDRKNCQAIFDKMLSEFKILNTNIFLIALLGLFTLKYHMFDQSFEIWTANFKHLDPRLMIYIFNDSDSEDIFGSVWTYHALFDIVEELKQMKKVSDMKDFFKLYLNTCLAIDFKKDCVPIGKSIEVALIKLGISNNEDLEPVIHEVKYSTNEVIELLLLNKKYFVLSKFYSKLEDHRQLLYYWKGLIENEFQDAEFDKNFKDKNKSLQYLVNYILTNCINDNTIIERYSEWLLDLYPKFGFKLITDKKIKRLEMNDIKILNLLGSDVGDGERSRLKLKYLEYIFENKNEKQFIGDLILLYMDIIIIVFENNLAIKEIIDNSLKKYMQLNVPKVSIYKYWKTMKEMDLSNSQEFINYHDRLYTYLNLVSVGMKSILDQKLVIDVCREKILGTELFKHFPLIAIMILFKLEDYDKLVENLIELKDFRSAEEFAIRLKLEPINSKVSLESIKMENIIESSSGFVINDEIITNTDFENNKLTEQLLKKIFDIYLRLNETKLIDHFLNNYDLLNDSTEETTTTLDRMTKFVNVLNKVPDNFPLDRLKTFMINNLIEFKDYNDGLVIKKTLTKVEVNRLNKINGHLSGGTNM